jgi:hypothetical protein
MSYLLPVTASQLELPGTMKLSLPQVITARCVVFLRSRFKLKKLSLAGKMALVGSGHTVSGIRGRWLLAQRL